MGKIEDKKYLDKIASDISCEMIDRIEDLNVSEEGKDYIRVIFAGFMLSRALVGFPEDKWADIVIHVSAIAKDVAESAKEEMISKNENDE